MNTTCSLALLIVSLSGFALGQTAAAAAPRVMIFAGGSTDPNNATSSANGDVGGAKLIGDSTYLGVVAHFGSKGVTPFQLTTKVQLHLARYLDHFRSAKAYWTAEVGPDFNTSSVPAGATPQVGYAVGSGPLLAIPLGHQVYLMPHAEVVKGSLQDLGWRGGVLFGFGSN